MPRQLEETFAVDGPSGHLLRYVVPRRGKPYVHSCSRVIYEEAAYAIDRLDAAPFTLESIVEKMSGCDQSKAPPLTQVAVALAFLKERGCVVPTRGRRHVAATDDVYLDAMIEYHALREKGPEEEQGSTDTE